MRQNKVNIGILSTANIAIRSVIPTLQELNEIFNIVGIASRDPLKSIEVGNSLNIKSFESYIAILNDPTIEAIYIPLPNALHYKWVKKALEKGLHVLVEKSMGCSLQEVEDLNQLATKNKLVLIENFQFRFHSQLGFIKKLLKEGRIGELRCLRSSFGFPPFTDSDNIRFYKSLGGGALLDAGAYPIKISQLFLGLDLEVAASNLFVDEKKDVDVWGGAYMKQRNGNLFAEIAFGFDNFYQCNLEIWGSKGKITATRIFTAPQGYRPEIVLETSKGKENIILEPDNHFKNMLIYFHQLIIDPSARDDEYRQNINQARLLEDINKMASSYVK